MEATQINPWILISIGIWTVFWRGIALWRAAKLGQKTWFIAILLISVYFLGVLEIVYLFYFSKKRLTLEEVKTWKKSFSS